MAFKLPPGKVVQHTAHHVQVSAYQPMPLPMNGGILGHLQQIENMLFNGPDMLEELCRRFKNLPEFISERMRRSPNAMSPKQAALYVYDYLSDAAKHFGFKDIMNGPNDFIEVEFPNFYDVTGALEIRLVAKNERGNELIVELEQMETTLELKDWHR